MTRAECECRYRSFDELGCVDSDVAARRWLSDVEFSYWGRIRAQQRRRSWLAGRILAKEMILQRLQTLPQPSDRAARSICIRSFDAAGRGNRPSVLLCGQQLECELSISHSSRGVLVGIAGDRSVRIGVDLVERQRAGPGFQQLWLTKAERRWLRRSVDPPWELARLWAAKEAVYKACHRGESFAPLRIEVTARQGGSLGCNYDDRRVGSGTVLQTWRVDRHVAALVIWR